MAVAKGQPASMLNPIGWAISMVILVVGAKLVFEFPDELDRPAWPGASPPVWSFNRTVEEW